MIAEDLRQRPNPPRGERRRVGQRLPHEGDDGLFTQSWFPLCASEDVPAGAIKGFDFLDGRVVVYRGADGTARVMSAYCPHVGADLANGTVVGNHVRCAFHHWEFDENGVCARTGFGDPPPRNACLYNFPTQERFGFVWAFNGNEPLWDLMDFEIPDDRLLMKTFIGPTAHCDGWIFATNTSDMQHVQAVHGISFDLEKVIHEARWDDWGYMLAYEGRHKQGEPCTFDRGIRGTSTFLQQGRINGWWMGVHGGFTLPRPGRHEFCCTVAVEKSDPQAAEHLDFVEQTLIRINSEDFELLNTIRHRAGSLTHKDKALAQYLKFLRTYPRAHPSADFIR